jgi:hypothetical protein
MSKYDAQEPLSPRWCLFLIAWAVALGLLAGTANAATYGPPVPVERVALPDGYSLVPVETMEQTEARLTRDTRSAWRTFWIGQSLAGADLAMTCIALSKKNPDGTPKFREANPIFGRNASCESIAAIKFGVGALQYFLARSAIRRDPTAAKKSIRWTVAINGAIVGWNAAQLAK